jgi:hypothetical protein
MPAAYVAYLAQLLRLVVQGQGQLGWQSAEVLLYATRVVDRLARDRMKDLRAAAADAAVAADQTTTARYLIELFTAVASAGYLLPRAFESTQSGPAAAASNGPGSAAAAPSSPSGGDASPTPSFASSPSSGQPAAAHAVFAFPAPVVEAACRAVAGYGMWLGARSSSLLEPCIV